MWNYNINLTILRKYTGNGGACVSSGYQASSLLTRGLGTRLVIVLHDDPIEIHGCNY